MSILEEQYEMDLAANSSTVDHPSHYQGRGIEAIDIIEAFDLNFRLGNAVKYILRSDKKGKRKEDLEKAIWYLKRELKNCS